MMIHPLIEIEPINGKYFSEIDVMKHLEMDKPTFESKKLGENHTIFYGMEDLFPNPTASGILSHFFNHHELYCNTVLLIPNNRINL